MGIINKLLVEMGKEDRTAAGLPRLHAQPAQAPAGHPVQEEGSPRHQKHPPLRSEGNAHYLSARGPAAEPHGVGHSLETSLARSVSESPGRETRTRTPRRSSSRSFSTSKSILSKICRPRRLDRSHASNTRRERQRGELTPACGWLTRKGKAAHPTAHLSTEMLRLSLCFCLSRSTIFQLKYKL